MASATPRSGDPDRHVFSVSTLAEMLQGVLADVLPNIWIQGEISNFRNPSGHWYFTLKDAGAQIRCAMFKSSNFYVRPQPRDGDEVLIRGNVGFYVARGDLQIIVEHLEPAGAGALLRAFEELKKKLSAEGLFDEKLKRAIPVAPRAIGLITSSKGAAIQDVLTTLKRRFPLGSVFVYPVAVQGEAAVPGIVSALRQLPLRAPVDVVLLARGGGSIEDLWCFNDERVARAIRACTVPVVTGIGHEVDFTIADFVADLRAPTPTAAAELISPDQNEWRARVQQLHGRLARCTTAGLQEQSSRLQRMQSRVALLHPTRRLQQHLQRLDEVVERLRRIPGRRLAQLQAQLGGRTELMRLRATQRFAFARQRLRSAEAMLGSVSPLATLARGYAIVRGPSGEIVTRAKAVQPGDRLDIVVSDGGILADVAQPKT